MTHKIVEISVYSMFESGCDRTTFYVRVTTDEGMDKDVEGHRTRSVYDPDGISIDEARDRALMDADTWSDFLGIPVTPLINKETGEPYRPSMTFNTYTMRRELDERRKTKVVKR